MHQLQLHTYIVLQVLIFIFAFSSARNMMTLQTQIQILLLFVVVLTQGQNFNGRPPPPPWFRPPPPFGGRPPPFGQDGIGQLSPFQSNNGQQDNGDFEGQGPPPDQGGFQGNQGFPGQGFGQGRGRGNVPPQGRGFENQGPQGQAAQGQIGQGGAGPQGQGFGQGPPDGDFDGQRPPPPFGGFGGMNGPPPEGGMNGPPPEDDMNGPPEGGFNGPPDGSRNGPPDGGMNGPPNGGGMNGPQGGRHGPRCRADQSTNTLPDCLQKFLQNGTLLDGNGNTCVRQGFVQPKYDVKTLLQKAELAVTTGSCQGEAMGPPPRSCSAGKIGNCETSTLRLQSVYVEKDLGDSLLIVTNGVPDHCYGNGVPDPIPNIVCEHYRAMLVPKNPRKTQTFTEHPMGPVGISISGAFFYNHLSGERGCNVAGISEKLTFDPCDGHADPTCRYHYHKAPTCIPKFDQCGLLGYANDGFPIYGKCTLISNSGEIAMKSCYRKLEGKNGCHTSHYEFDPKTPGCNLDRANGFTFKSNARNAANISFTSGTYSYFFTPEYPFIMPGVYGDRSVVKWCVIS